MKTAYFTFGQCHAHSVDGQTFDKDTIVKITAEDPRAKMFEVFGVKWSMQYDEPPSPELYPSGIIELNL